MPLSEQEQRLLDEMERNLLHNDADVVSAESAGRPFTYRNLVFGALLVVAGLGALIAGVSLFRDLAFVGIIIGVVGVALMFVGIMVGARRGEPTLEFDEEELRRESSRPSGPRSTTGGNAGFMDRMNERWERRQDSDD
ncbi:DUF3040 domain-containing protein [Microbacterium sp. ZW T5_56]|uniref:DUF3040 domain-containing protein n=1 Tax=Microbacterium sp. ZW T5_56 TaxID=3378081 RepID=UPI003854B928